MYIHICICIYMHICIYIYVCMYIYMAENTGFEPGAQFLILSSSIKYICNLVEGYMIFKKS